MDERWGYVDTCSDVVIPAIFRTATRFYQDGYAIVETDDGFGVIDRSGDTVVPPIYEGIDGWIDAEGGLSPPQAEGVGTLFRDGRTPVQRDGKIGYVDPTGQEVIPPRFTGARRFSEGVAAVLVEEKGSPTWGYVRSDGSFALEPAYFWATDFKEGVAVVRTDGWAAAGVARLIDQEGRSVLPKPYPSLELFEGDLVRVRRVWNGPWGLLTHDGHEVIPAEHTLLADHFSEGLLAAQAAGGGWGYLDHEGNWAIAPEYTYVTDFRAERAFVARRPDPDRFPMEVWIIDPSGERAAESSFTDAARGFVGEGYAVAATGPWGDLADGPSPFPKEVGIVQTDGTWVHEPVYDKMHSIVAGWARAVRGGDELWLSVEGDVVPVRRDRSPGAE